MKKQSILQIELELEPIVKVRSTSGEVTEAQRIRIPDKKTDKKSRESNFEYKR